MSVKVKKTIFKYSFDGEGRGGLKVKLFNVNFYLLLN